jgi:phosphoribosylanthranilate isomerase
MTWVKICGITNLEDALVAVDAGADAVGFVFYEKSPRCVTVEKAREIISKLPEKAEKVGVFVNELEDLISSVIDETRITAVQMHGDKEDPHVADLLVKRYTAIRVLPAVSMRHLNPQGWAMMWHPDAVQAFLVDSGDSSKVGGTGKTFDWNGANPLLEEIKKVGRVAVAGGLTPWNVGDAIETTKPWGVDVASGVEAHPGKKDPEKVRAFVRAVREYDAKVS